MSRVGRSPGGPDPVRDDLLLRVRGLRTEFRREDGVVRAVDGVDFDVRRGRALAIVGESGSGKSVSVRSLLRLLPSTARVVDGQAYFSGANGATGGTEATGESRATGGESVDLLKLPERRLRRIRGRDIGMVFQNAMEAMNPTLTLERQLTEHLLWHGICGKSEARERAVRALGDVGIPEPEKRIRTYPFQLSGGQRQRAMIAMAMITRPKLLIADEPTTAVDVTVQRQLLDLLAASKETGAAVIMITHDLGVARYFCDDIAVMYAGRVVEHARTDELLDAPRHPYTVGLLGSSVELGSRGRPLLPIPGSPPDLGRRPEGCAFRPRCAHASDGCQRDQSLAPVGPADSGHEAACWKAVSDRELAGR